MAHQTSTHTPWHRAKLWLPYGLLAIIALALRLPQLGGFVTIDEVKFWLPRSEQFLQVMQTGNYAHMPMVGHPGITTMWLGSMGIALRRILYEQGIIPTETYSYLLTLHRLPTVLMQSILLMFGYALLNKLASPTHALLTALLWATDPFVLAYSRILHVDALAGSFATVSLLAACLSFPSPTTQSHPSRLSHQQRAHRGWLSLSGIGAGLAIMSKLPALALLPTVAILALRVSPRLESRESTGQRQANAIVARTIMPLVLWGGIAIATMVIITPLAWVEPLRVLDGLRYGIESEGGEPHMWGNFFMGQPVDVPNILFYPVAIALRTTPWVLIGLFLLPWALRARQRTIATPGDASMGHGNLTLSPRDLALMAGFILLFVVAMSIFPKKMNRYLVPIVPVLTILAAYGLEWGAKTLAQLAPTRWQQRTAQGIRATLVIVAIGNAAVWMPYYVAYANPLLGGAPVGARTFLTGWGEGMEQAAAWLNEQPDITSVVTLTSLRSVLMPYLRDGGYATSDEQGHMPNGTGYALIYLSHLQRGLTAPYASLYADSVPIHTVRIHGVPYVWIYQVAQPMPYPLTATFGDSLRLQGYTSDITQIADDMPMLNLTLQWQTMAAMTTDYRLFVHVFDDQGNQVGQLDVPLLDPRHGTGEPPTPTSAWQVGRVFRWQHPVPLPAHPSPTSKLWVAIGVYHPDDFARLPLRGAALAQPGAPDDGDHALFLPAVEEQWN